MKYAISLFFLLTSLFCSAQIPLAEIEGRLSIYLPDDTTSVHIGKNAGVNQDLSITRRNTFVGGNTGRQDSIGIGNSFYGYSAGARNTGSENSTFGYTAGGSSGSYNSSFGSGAGQDMNNGFSNSHFGAYAGASNQMGNQNTFIGMSSGSANRFGNNNTYVGFYTGFANDDGNNNVIIGDSAAWRINGSSNVIIGHYAGPYDVSTLNSVNLNNCLYIDNDHNPNPLIYGEFDNNIVRIHGRLDTENGTMFMRNLGNNDTNQGLKWGESNDDPAFGITYDGAGQLGNNRLHIRKYIDNTQSDLITIKADGNVGIGNDNPESKLDINGIIHLRASVAQSGDCGSVADYGKIAFDTSANKLSVCADNDAITVGDQPGWVKLH